MLLVMFVDVGY